MLLMVTQTREAGSRQKDNNISISGQLLSLICTKNNHSFVHVFTSPSTRHLLRFCRIQCRFFQEYKGGSGLRWTLVLETITVQRRRNCTDIAQRRWNHDERNAEERTTVRARVILPMGISLMWAPQRQVEGPVWMRGPQEQGLMGKEGWDMFRSMVSIWISVRSSADVWRKVWFLPRGLDYWAKKVRFYSVALKVFWPFFVAIT